MKLDEEDVKSYFAEYEVEEQQYTYFVDLIELLKRPVFVFSSLSTTVLLFISNAITFWGTEFMEGIMKFDKSDVEIGFLLVALTGPVIGAICGGVFVQKIIGGYEKKHSISFVVIQLFIASLLVPVFWLAQTIIQFTSLLWFIFFFAASTIPIIQGISISSLPLRLKGSGNSVYNLLIFLGFSASTYYYGAIYSVTKDTEPKLAFFLTLCWSVIALICSIICLIFRFRRFNDPSSEEIKNLRNIQSEVEFTPEIKNNSVEMKKVD